MLSSDTNNPREDCVFLSVKGSVRRAGCGGPGAVVALLREFRELEEEQHARGEKGVTRKLFMELLQDFGVRLSESETAYVCAAFDDDRDGYITSTRFVRHLTGLNERRHKAILRAWEVLPKNEKGEVPRTELQDRYARTGTRADLTATFSTAQTEKPLLHHPMGSSYKNTTTKSEKTSGNDGVSLEEFIAFYAAVSPEIAVDEQFELYMLREWDADAPARPTMSETHREWGPNGDPLAITKPLLVQDALNTSLATSTKQYNYSHMQRVHPYVEPLPPLERDYLSITKRDFRPYTKEEQSMADTLCHR
ncbi:uncharacterized protein TM35_000182500 [Trypanosoma theileri]|uniref:EF-hand domain-containing protein n=1 Tax=Trypanosoma theileri TaxID=67003 RepID=A0A1X0NUM9_9TRYP|nr:uncharacterized protein TM35_000182500 [Trypanosoma theileri]ORC88193.1 hypothetical protein TM35_000182500 [Trypanosoma theileri]